MGRRSEVEVGGSLSGDENSVSESVASVGKYQLLAVLGRGGMADVFLALSRGPMGFNKLVVVKRLRASLADDTAFRSMFLDEARLAARLNHPNVVHTYEVGQHKQAFFIAMEYLEGQSLNKVIKEAVKRDSPPFDPVFCARIISDALSGLHHAHELRDYDGTPLRIIHRDVSPHNVFVTYDGSVKLVDFGIAKAALSSVETEVGVLKGKVAYMSPEQASGGKIDARADIFSMGIVAWEMLTRQRLMTGESAAATLHRLLMLPVPLASSIRHDIDPALDAIIARALEKEPDRRYQSAQEMRDALEGYIARAGGNIRQDEVGRVITDMFKNVRAEIQRQIQEHMESITQVPMRSGELAAMSSESRRHVAAPSPLASSELPVLAAGGGSGSGSGVIANLPAQPNTFATYPPAAQPPAEGEVEVEPSRKRAAALWLSLSALVGLIAFIAFSFERTPSRQAVGLAQTVTEFGDPKPPTATGPVIPPVVPDSTMEPPLDNAQPAPPRATFSKPVAAVPRHPSSSPPQRDTERPKPPAAAPTATTAAAAAQPPEDSNGYLSFDTYPWTRVSEGGKSLGTTPLFKLPLSPGLHTLTVENSEQGIKQTYSVTIKAGETVSRRLGLK